MAEQGKRKRGEDSNGKKREKKHKKSKRKYSSDDSDGCGEWVEASSSSSGSALKRDEWMDDSLSSLIAAKPKVKPVESKAKKVSIIIISMEKWPHNTSWLH